MLNAVCFGRETQGFTRNPEAVYLPTMKTKAMLVLLLGIVMGLSAQDAVRHGPTYRLVNNTGTFSNAEIFWSLDHGKSWHAFAESKSVPCPLGNGRLYFQIGSVPKSTGDRTALCDFIEYASENSDSWHGNTTQVDAFILPISITMGEHRVGIAESRRELFRQFAQQAPEPFKSCVQSDRRIVSPCRAAFGAGGVNAHYFDAYLDAVWAEFAGGKQTASGKWIGTVTDGALTFTSTDGKGRTLTCQGKPTTQDVFLGTGVLKHNPEFCAAINRHVLAEPENWHRPAAYYQAEPCNWYAKFFHEHSLDRKAYGFCYDDAAGQAAFFSGKGTEVVVTIGWENEAVESKTSSSN